MKEAIIAGHAPAALALAKQAMDEGVTPEKLINDGVIPAMETVGNKFETGEYFLPEMMASAISTKGIMNVLRPMLAETGVEPVARAVIGSVKGDLHDIGKNLVAMMWEGAGFEVIDLGPDVHPDKFVQAIKDHNVRLVGLSALLTTTMPMMKATIQALENAGVRKDVVIMIGGPGVNDRFVAEIGADGFAPNASSAASRAKELLGIG